MANYSITALWSRPGFRLHPDQGPASAFGDNYQLPPVCQKVESTVDRLQTGLEKISKRLEKCAARHKPDEALAEAFRLAGDSLGDAAPQLSRMLEALHDTESEQLRNRAHMYEQLTGICRDKFKEREETLKCVSRQRRDITKLAEDLAKTQKRLSQQQQQPQPNQQAIQELHVDLGTKTSELRRQRDAYSQSLMNVVGLHSDCCSDLRAMLKARLAYHRECANLLADRDRQLEDELAHITRTSGPCYRIELDEHLKTTERQIAYVLEVCIRELNKPAVLEEEGLFRTNGSASAVMKLESNLNLMQAEGAMAEFEPSAICGALKKYLKSLPTPLVGSGELIDSWYEACQIAEPDQRVEALAKCCRKLEADRPDFYRNLRYLVKFLARVVQLQDQNKMSPKNLGICIGPNIFYNCGQASEMNEIEMANIGSQLIENLISQHENLFGQEEPDFGTAAAPLECQTPQSSSPSPQRLSTDTVQPRRPPPPRQSSFGTAGCDTVDGAPQPASPKHNDAAAKVAASDKLQRPKPPPPPQQQQQPEPPKKPLDRQPPPEPPAEKPPKKPQPEPPAEKPQPEPPAEKPPKKPLDKQQPPEPPVEKPPKKPEPPKKPLDRQQQPEPPAEKPSKKPLDKQQQPEPPAEKPPKKPLDKQQPPEPPAQKPPKKTLDKQQPPEAQSPPELPRRPQPVAAQSSEKPAVPAASPSDFDRAFQLPRPSGPPPPPPAALPQQQLLQPGDDSAAPPAAAAPPVAVSPSLHKKRIAPQPPRPPPPSPSAVAASSAAAPSADS